MMESDNGARDDLGHVTELSHVTQKVPHLPSIQSYSLETEESEVFFTSVEVEESDDVLQDKTGHLDGASFEDGDLTDMATKKAKTGGNKKDRKEDKKGKKEYDQVTYVDEQTDAKDKKKPKLTSKHAVGDLANEKDDKNSAIKTGVNGKARDVDQEDTNGEKQGQNGKKNGATSEPDTGDKTGVNKKLPQKDKSKSEKHKRKENKTKIGDIQANKTDDDKDKNGDSGDGKAGSRKPAKMKVDKVSVENKHEHSTKKGKEQASKSRVDQKAGKSKHAETKESSSKGKLQSKTSSKVKDDLKTEETRPNGKKKDQYKNGSVVQNNGKIDSVIQNYSDVGSKDKDRNVESQDTMINNDKKTTRKDKTKDSGVDKKERIRKGKDVKIDIEGAEDKMESKKKDKIKDFDQKQRVRSRDKYDEDKNPSVNDDDKNNERPKEKKPLQESKENDQKYKKDKKDKSKERDGKQNRKSRINLLRRSKKKDVGHDNDGVEVDVPPEIVVDEVEQQDNQNNEHEEQLLDKDGLQMDDPAGDGQHKEKKDRKLSSTSELSVPGSDEDSGSSKRSSRRASASSRRGSTSSKGGSRSSRRGSSSRRPSSAGRSSLLDMDMDDDPEFAEQFKAMMMKRKGSKAGAKWKRLQKRRQSVPSSIGEDGQRLISDDEE